MVWIVVLLIVSIAGFVGYKYLKNKATDFVTRYRKVDLPPGYKLVSMNKDLYIMKSPDGKQEIVYFAEHPELKVYTVGANCQR